MAVVKTGKSMKLKTIEMELALAEYFNKRTNLIVPNVSWGMGIEKNSGMPWGFNQCDLLVITKNGCAYQIEIKVSKSDLIADHKKKHAHLNQKIRKLYFAIPDYLKNCEQYIPDHAGIISIDSFLSESDFIKPFSARKDGNTRHCHIIREAKIKSDYKFTNEEKYNVARLGTLRMWRLKEKIAILKETVPPARSTKQPNCPNNYLSELFRIVSGALEMDIKKVCIRSWEK